MQPIKYRNIHDKNDEPTVLTALRVLEDGEEVGLTEGNAPNYNYFGVAYDDQDEDDFEAGMGYDAVED